MSERNDTCPLWVCPESQHIILETFSPGAKQAGDFLMTIAEPVSRPKHIHEYKITPFSLSAALSGGLTTSKVVEILGRFAKLPLPDNLVAVINAFSESYGKVRIVLRGKRHYLESKDAGIIQQLLHDPVISQTRDIGPDKMADEGYVTDFSFGVMSSKYEEVCRRCTELGYPVLEEYNFHNDHSPSLGICVKAKTEIRPYQVQSLQKMFSNGKACSGIIVLPCGAGKTLVGIAAACTINKSLVCLCNTSISAMQWKQQFMKYSTVKEDQIAVFTSDQKTYFQGPAGIVITTYSMIANARGGSEDTQNILEFIKSREWGMLLLDEVHVTPADMFRNAVSNINAHVKLGLTATLLREDGKIDDLNFLVGPKLYEANWMDLTEQGYIAPVQCAEVRCPMPAEFYNAYLSEQVHNQALLGITNPNKIRACQYLVNYHARRGDKIIVFVDDIFALTLYAKVLKAPYIYGGTSHTTRMQILEEFQKNPAQHTIILSKIGDTSIDLPAATCLIQVSSHFGSRRQETQHLGRILRASARDQEGFNAYFYTLVSEYTQEVRFSAKRRQFLADQGYSFKTIIELEGMDDLELVLASAESQASLLRRVKQKLSESGAVEVPLLSKQRRAKEPVERHPLFKRRQRTDK